MKKSMLKACFLFILLFARLSYAESPIKVSLSFDMIRGLPPEAHCLKRVQTVFPSIQVENVPWKRIILALQHGQTDLTPCIFKTEEREKIADFFGPIAHLPIIMVSDSTKNLEFDDIHDFSGVFLLGTSLIKDYTTEDMKITEVNSIDNIFKMIRLGRADYTLMPGNFINERDTTGLKVAVIDKIPLYIGVSKKSALNQYIMDMLSQKLGSEHPAATQ